ncbi:ImmA/IrrE family metallo-endopeptidase [Pleomorphomonas oryzae]|uniref:ImmA/IrrE family metallo-endopeptidase n=1 Tax=Pleomorphomonas oryzae TaxID=261934 RepID=UPI0003F7258D|nr:ImmA/IrrE family metallo-endopeptidase [Pleomorphomonas oryzae]
MQITRLDLDGTGSPEGLVTKILKAEPGLAPPVPIEALAAALDIIEIRELEAEGFEGSLLMDAHRSRGVILVNKLARAGRRRFTIGHELGHFLIPMHRPVKNDAFLCSRDDMRLWSAAEQNAYERMEVEANKFAALMLMPPPLLRPYLSRYGDPNIATVLRIHKDFEVSKDAAARAYTLYHGEPITMIVVHEGKVLRSYRALKAPRLSVEQGGLVPRSCIYWRTRGLTAISQLEEASSDQWLISEWGKRPPALYEQVLHQQEGYALLMLWPEFEEEDDEFDPDADRTAKQRLSDRLARSWHGRY